MKKLKTKFQRKLFDQYISRSKGLIFIVSFLLLQNICYTQQCYDYTTPYYSVPPEEIDNDPNYMDYLISYKLIFDDEFNSPVLDRSKWADCFPDCARTLFGKPSDPLTINYNSPGSNMEISNGTLKLTARRESVFQRANDCKPPNMSDIDWDNSIMADGGVNKRWFTYTTGMVLSRTRFPYGKFEIACRIPPGSGLHPAFWVLGDDPTNSGHGGEVDCFEFVKGETNKMGTNYHVWGNGSDCDVKVISNVDLAAETHTYAVAYTPARLEYFLDGNLVRVVNKWYWDAADGYYLKDPGFPDPNWKMYITAGLGVDNAPNWNPIDPNAFPATLEIDYIRYYKPLPCNNITLNLQWSDLVTTLNDVGVNATYHSISENTVNISNAAIGSGQQLRLGACSEVKITGEFVAASGSNFVVEVNNKFCCSPSPPPTKLMSGDNNGNSHNSSNNTNSPVKSQLKNTGNIQNTSQYSIYPNPNNGEFLFRASQITNNSSFEVRNVLGQLVLKGNVLDTETRINLKDFDNGIYMLTLLENGAVINKQKVVKQ